MRIITQGKGGEEMPDIDEKKWPLTGAQAGIWFAQQLDPASAVFNTAECIVIHGPLDVETFEKALRQTVEEAEALHMRFGEDGDGPWQTTAKGYAWPLPVLDVSNKPAPYEAAEEWMKADLSKTVNLSEGPLFSEALFQLAPDRFLWYQRIHHIAIDGFGFSLLARRAAQLYTSYTKGGTAEETAFGSFELIVQQDAAYSASPQLKEDREYWLSRFSDGPEAVSLGNKAAKASGDFLRYSGRLPADRFDSLQEAAQRAGASWADYCIALAALYVHRLTGAEDVILALPVMSRLGSVSLRVPAIVMNLLPLRLSLKPSMSLQELVRQTAREVRELKRHQGYRQHDIRRDLKLLGEGKRLFGPLINVMPFDYDLSFGGLKGTVRNLSAGPVDDLSVNLYCRSDGSGLFLDLDGNPEVYTTGELASHHRRFLALLQQAGTLDSSRPIGEIGLLLPEEHRLLLEEWRGAERTVSTAGTQGLFEEQAARVPGAPAIVFEDTVITYAELNRRVNRLASLLKLYGVGPESIVALTLPRSAEIVIAMLAVHKTGAAYLPLDPEYPEDRIMYMLEDASPACIITNSRLAVRLPAESKAYRILLDDPSDVEKLLAQPDSNPDAAEREGYASPYNPAYVIYTSGSTGRPKGVVISFHGLINYLESMQETLQLKEGERMLAVTTIAFDISILEIFLPLLTGACVDIASRDTILDPSVLAQRIRDTGATIMQATPTLWRALVSAVQPGEYVGLRAISGGEALPEGLRSGLERLGCRVINLYGPTETTIYSTAAYYEPGLQGKPSIGQPLWNTQIYVLDAGLAPVPPEVAGDLYIAGDGLARGYLGRPGLTAERFVADPFGKPGSRMYRTGDLARWLPDGTIDFLGRADHQVKMRGFRIEPGEIEGVLIRHPGLEQVFVMVREDQPGDMRLVAYVVPAPGQTPDPVELRHFAGSRLPDYMVPSAYVSLAELPLTPNKKIDRKALPAPGLTVKAEGRSPRTPQEEILCGLFAEVLGLPRVGIDDDFFVLGGHSLLAGRVVVRIREALGVELRIGSLFESPTVAALAKGLQHAQAARPAVRKEDRTLGIPLSFAQQRLWFLHCLEGPSPTYNIPLVARLNGPLDPGLMEEALGDVAERHEILRTIFPEALGSAQQLILAPHEAKPQLSVTAATPEELPGLLDEAVRYSFDLAKEPALKACLFTLSPEEHVLLILLHHIAGDGWSLTPLTRDLGAAYTARRRGGAAQWPELPVQYADYALWQRELLGSGDDAESLAARQLAYWTKALADLPEQLELPAARPRPSSASYLGGTVPFHIEPKLHRQLAGLGRDGKASLFMVLHSALAALLTRLGAGTDIPVGTPIAGRNDDALDQLAGLFINTLVLRADTSGDPSFRELLARIREVNLAAYEHQELPFERLVEVLNPVRSRARHPLFQIMLVLQNTPDARLELPDVTADLELKAVGSSKFDLTVELTERRSAEGVLDGIDGLLEFSQDLFDREAVEIFAGRFLRLLAGAVEEPDAPIGQLDILSQEEWQSFASGQALEEQEAQAPTLVELFEVQAAYAPQSPAAVCEDISLSYGELNNQANRLARYLIKQGAGPERMVALALPRSVELVTGLLAVLKSGAAYLPLDPDYPEDRLAYMLEDAKPVCIVTCRSALERLPRSEEMHIIVLDEPVTAGLLRQELPDNLKEEERSSRLSSLSPAYMIYTSGSTGMPKGVVIPHRNVVRLLTATEDWFHFGSGDVWTLFHSYAFDFSVWEIWGALLYGGKVVVVPHAVSRSPSDFLQLLIREGVTVLNQTPSAFYQLMQADKEAVYDPEELKLRYIVFGGEALELGRLEDWYGRHADNAPVLINMYGITETTVHVTFKALDRQVAAARANSLIGLPIPDLRVYVLDHRLNPAPTGVTGEMYVGGAGLARGYWGRPGLTAERFVADPYGPPGARMYRTGDLARRLADGTLDYLGRADHQVKIRGFRIETGEIEAVLARHPDVGQVAVIVREDQPGDKRLAAYVVHAPDRTCEPSELRRYAAAILPDYMVPSAIVAVPALPLTPNGKLDKKALPAPEFSPASSGRGPRTPQEEILCDLFAEVLGIPRVGIDDGFFELGGHSLLAVRLMSGIRDALGAELGIGTLFEAPTVAGLAERLEGGDSRSALQVLLPLRTQGDKPPLFCIHPAGGLSWCYAGLIKSMGSGYPLYGVQARGIAGQEELPATLEEMAADYIQHIRSVQPQGPYHLLGWSLGGNVAHAIAVQLQREGDQVRLLAMLDAYPSHFLSLRGGPDEEEALIALLALGGYDPDSMDDKPLTMSTAIEILRSDGSALASLEEGTIWQLKETFVNSVRLLSSFVPGRFEGDLLFFRSTIIPEWFDPIEPEAWLSHIDGQIHRHDIACRHKDLCQPEPLTIIGGVLAAHLQTVMAPELQLTGGKRSI
jgi:nonribosomal peptide synthetase DhbF